MITLPLVLASLLEASADININQSLLNIVTAFAAFLGGAIALALLYGAFLLIFAVDDPDMEARGKRAIRLAIYGAVLGVGAVTVANLIITNIK
jgi:hypothetical protein